MPSSIFEYTVQKGGKPYALRQLRNNRATLIVNTASLCGFSLANLKMLNDLQTRYHPRGFTVLAFPCSQFANQEPLDAEGLQQWIEKNEIQFPVFDKVNVVVSKPNVEPLFEMLQMELGPIRWNYTKFLCDAAGIPRAKYQPVSLTLESDIETYLV